MSIDKKCGDDDDGDGIIMMKKVHRILLPLRTSKSVSTSVSDQAFSESVGHTGLVLGPNQQCQGLVQGQNLS